MTKSSPIGLFDSGLGGLTVLKEVSSLLPNEDVIYLGDTARVPYGTKSPDTIIKYCIQNTELLIKNGAKVIVVACNTASALALEELKKKFSVPIIGVIEPALTLIRKNAKIAILATPRTIESKIYEKLIFKNDPYTSILSIACPLFVPLVEEGLTEHPATELIAKSYLKKVKNQVDQALLACTHYPLMKKIIQNEIGKNVELIEPAFACAQHLKQTLASFDLLQLQTRKPDYKFFCTDDPAQFRLLGEKFLGKPILKVEKKTLS